MVSGLGSRASVDAMNAAVIEPKIESLWTIEQVAHRFSLARRQIHRLMERGGFVAPVRIGGALRFDPHDIEAYIESQKQRGNK